MTMKTPLLSDADIQARLATLKGWSVKDNKLEKKFSFPYKQGELSPFMKGLLLIERIAALAEAADHHPDILFTYPAVTVQLTTHDSGGLTEKDFQLAQKIDAITGE
jgi:4a-hydroxytetrahydrobiopterin dehydratase